MNVAREPSINTAKVFPTPVKNAKKEKKMANWYQQHVSDVIEGNEQAWSSKVCHNDVLPKSAEKYLDKLLKIGAKQVPLPDGFKYDGDYFTGIKLPDGWQKRADGRDGRHIVVYDNFNQKRATMFVKYGGYDRFTSFSLEE